MFYSDEHAMTLGIREIKDTTCFATTTTDYPISMMVGDPSHAVPPLIGAPEAAGGTDPAGRPMYPVLYITDVTENPGNPLAGDWQMGGTGIAPDAVFGTWKGAVKTVNHTTNTVTVTPDADPAANGWNLDGTGPCPGANCPDPVPAPTPANQGYGTEVRWNLNTHNFIPGHEYRLYFMVHDGDQNKTGGDVGQDCVYFVMPGTAPTPTATPSPSPTASPSPTSTPTPTPGVMIAGDQTFAGKTVTVTVQNDTGSNQVLTALSFNWPTTPNGKLSKITLGGTTIWNAGSTTGSLSIPPPPLQGSTAQRTIAPGACATMTFSFQNNVSTNPSLYSGSATFSPYGSVTIF
jgi:hypothetical protein